MEQPIAGNAVNVPASVDPENDNLSFVQKLVRACKDPRRTWRRTSGILLESMTILNNVVIDLDGRPPYGPSGLDLFDEVSQRAETRTDISDHLQMLFFESLPLRPSLIVELGVRGGESTFVLERVARLYNTKLVSVDINDCEKASAYPQRTFIKSDDIAFARQFAGWCSERGIKPSIDILFLDTSHEFEHTVQELTHWLPFMAPRSKVFFHDTNMRRVFVRKDGSRGRGWANERGVIAAMEKHFGCKFDETRDFVAFAGDWMVRHHANCSGMTILEKW